MKDPSGANRPSYVGSVEADWQVSAVAERALIVAQHGVSACAELYFYGRKVHSVPTWP